MDRLAQTCGNVASHGSRLKKIALLSEYFASLDDDDYFRAVHFLCCGPVLDVAGRQTLFATPEKQTLSLGSSTLREACRQVTGWDDVVLSRCYEDVGDTGETISLLLPAFTRGEPMTLARAAELYAELFRERITSRRVAILKSIFTTYQPLTIKYFIKMITRNFRIGLQAKMVEDAVAAATQVPVAAVREANNRLGDLAQVAIAARAGTLDQIEARLFHPLDFMLAKPLDSLDNLTDPAGFWIEHKYDGIRSQAHVENGHVQIYARGMDDISASFPDVIESLKALPGSAVLDGEILAWADDRALPFSVLQQRLARKRLSAQMLREIPVIFVAYDLLFQDGALLLDQPLERRRALLAALPVRTSPQYRAETTADIDRLFAEARTAGNEGLMLKHTGSLYESGRRSGAWLKLKRVYGTLDVVITGAEQGHGRRAVYLSDYTFAVRSGEHFLNVGKAYSGLTDPEVRELTKLLRAATTDRFGRVVLVRPEVVLEVGFDGVQKSPRHKGGYALRFPRILRWRKDKTAQESDTIDRVQELYEASLRVGTTP